MRKLLPVALCACLGLCVVLSVQAQQEPLSPPPASPETQQCLVCHDMATPGITADWRWGRHAYTLVSEAMQKPDMERRISATELPDELRNFTVGCYECHSLNADAHSDNVDHFGLRINIIVSPRDCAVCHPVEAEQYGRSKLANAHGNLEKNEVFSLLVNTIDSMKKADNGRVSQVSASEQTKSENCLACHGTNVQVESVETRDTDFGEMASPKLTYWPNHGVGRINPDGSMGACTACHPRHSFSIEIARQPQTCGQCHLEPDVPAYNVYMESKHGNIYSSRKQAWDFSAVPWKVGEDFNAPTCSACHSSLVTSADGTVISERTHDFSGRIWTRIFGVIYTYPASKSGDTSIIRNADGMPLPTTFTGLPAEEFLIGEQEQARRLDQMKGVCGACHADSYVDGHFARLDNTIRETDEMTLNATLLMVHAWDKGLADKENPFDEPIEIKWMSQWLFYANSVRYASAMSGPDFAGFKNGWWYLSKNLRDMEESMRLKKK